MRYLFGEYAFDTDRRELHRGGDAVSIAPQAFDLLDYLIRNRERVVSKDDLISAIWSGRNVSDAALTTRLNAARAAIGDSGEEQRLIRTIPRKGFRFVGTVQESHKLAVQALAGSSPQPPLPLPDKPSIAVLPFISLSSDPDQAYVADGIAEDIITALSRFRALFVIARNSSFTYKARAIDVKQVGRELGVRYLLEGSVRKNANRVRITAQLVDASTGAHLWADRFEGGNEDLFNLQDKITESVVGAIAPELQQAEIERARRKPTERLDAYDFFLRGMAREVADLGGGLEQSTIEGTSDALRLFYRAIELDPEFASAYGLASLCYAQRKAFGWMNDRQREIAEAERLARRAVQLGRDDAMALATGGYVLAFVVHELEAGIAAIERALVLNPNFAAAWLYLGWTKVWRCQSEAAIEHLERAVRLNPLGRGIAGTYAAMATAHFFANRYDQASNWAEMLLRQYPTSHPGLRISVASNALAGKTMEARRAVAELLKLDPAFRLSKLRNSLGPYPSDAVLKYESAMREAGLRE